MRNLHIFNRFALLFLSLVLSVNVAHASDNAHVVIGSEIDINVEDAEEVVAIGGLVEVKGTSQGDVLAIGGMVDADINADGDIVVIGGEVIIKGITTKDAFVIGGDVSLEITAADEMFAAGGNIEIGPNTNVAGTSSVFGGMIVIDGVFAGPLETGGGDIELAGQFSGDLNAGGDRVALDGYFSGDVVISALEISFGDNVQFLGDLTVRSPNEVTLPEGIAIGGDFTYEYVSAEEIEIVGAEFSEVMAIIGIAIATVTILFFVVFIVGAIIVAVTGSITRRGVTVARDEPWKAIGIGFGALLLMPIAFGILVAINDAFAPLFIIYALMAVVGFAMAGYLAITFISDKGRKAHSGGKRFGFAILGSFLLLIVCAIPILGGLVWLFAIIFGTGAFVSGLLSKDKPDLREPSDLEEVALEADQD